MKRILPLLMTFFMVTQAQAQVTMGKAKVGNATAVNMLNRIKNNYPNLIAYKDIALSSSLNLDYSVGSATATFTETRSSSSPGSYIDASGTMNYITTSDIPRKPGGYYATNGFYSMKPGILIESTATNLLVQSGVFTDAAWAATSATVAIDGAGIDGQNAYSVTATGSNATLIQAFSGKTNAKYTASVFIKRKTGTGTINLRARAADSYTNITASVTSGWTRVFSTASTNETVPEFDLQLVTSGDAVDICLAQVEQGNMTTYIPTTTTALTRNGSAWKFVNSGNSSATVETFLIQFMPESTFANDNIYRNLQVTDTKSRTIQKLNSGTGIRAQPNGTDNATVVATTTTVPQANTSYVFAYVMQHSSPYVNVFMNGVSENTYTAGDWTDPAWGTYFTIGGSSNWLNGIVRRFAKFNRALTATEVSEISKLWAAN